MTPAAATARRATTPRRAPSAPPRQKRQRLEVVATGSKTSNRRRIPELLAVLVLAGSLLAIVIGHSMLAQGQIRMGKISAELAQEQAVNRVTVLNVAALETPARISQEAGALHLVQPFQILQLPSVSLTEPLPPLKITAAPGHP